MNNKIKVAAYARVSTDMTDQLHSLSAQIKYFTEYISNHEDYEALQKILCKSKTNQTKVGLQRKRSLGFPLNRSNPAG